MDRGRAGHESYSAVLENDNAISNFRTTVSTAHCEKQL